MGILLLCALQDHGSHGLPMAYLRLSLVLGLILKPGEAFLAPQHVQNLKYARRRGPTGQRRAQGLGDRAELETIFLRKARSAASVVAPLQVSTFSSAE